MNTNIVGLTGELQACLKMDKYNSSMNLKYITNFPVRDFNDKYFQVDTLIVCSKGIFCIEIKNWEATVFCSADYYWTVLYPSGERTVKSPILQNQQHCNKVRAICGAPVDSVVLFVECAKLCNQPNNVMYVSEFLHYLEELPDKYSLDFINKTYNAFVEYKQQAELGLLVDFIFKAL